MLVTYSFIVISRSFSIPYRHQEFEVPLQSHIRCDDSAPTITGDILRCKRSPRSPGLMHQCLPNQMSHCTPYAVLSGARTCRISGHIFISLLDATWMRRRPHRGNQARLVHPSLTHCMAYASSRSTCATRLMPQTACRVDQISGDGRG